MLELAITAAIVALALAWALWARALQVKVDRSLGSGPPLPGHSLRGGRVWMPPPYRIER